MFDRLKRIFARHASSATVPELVVIDKMSSFWDNWTNMNKYERMERVYQMDPMVRGSIDRLAIFTGMAFQGFEGEKVSIQKWRAQITAIAKHLLIFGDVFLFRHNHQFAPIHSLTVLEDEEQIGKSWIDHVITKERIYVINEFSLKNDMRIYNKKRMIHIKLDDAPMLAKDIAGRETWSIYSVSPIYTLEDLILWKHQILHTDVVWRMRNLPREVHKVDLSMFSPEHYSGTWEEKVKASIRDSRLYLQKVVEKLKQLKPDQGYVVPKGYEIEFIEPRTANYRDPNQLIEQINDYVFASIGVHQTAVRGSSKNSYASELLIKGYTTILAQYLCHRIVSKLAPQYKPIISLEFGEIDRVEKIKEAAVLARMGIVTINELRQWIGLEPIEDGDVLIKSGALAGRPYGTHDEPMEGISYPLTPMSEETKREKQ